MKHLYKAAFICLFFFGIRSAMGQDIATDSKGKGVFTYFTLNKARVDFTSKDFSLTLAKRPTAITFVRKATSNVTVPDDTAKVNLLRIKQLKENSATTVEKRSTWFAQVTVLNATNIVSASELKFTDFRPGVRLRLGYQRVVDSIYTTWEGRAFAYGGNVFGAIDNIKLYDPGKGAARKRYPGSGGVEGNLTWFAPRWLAGERRWFVVAANTSLSYGWNDDALLNYKELSAATLLPTVVAFDKFDGKYGKLETGTIKWRLALSVPMSFGYYNPIPYVVVNTTGANKPTYFAGLYSNLLARPIQFRGFKLPTSFGAGFDSRYADGEWSKINVFVRGNISFGQF